MNETKATTELLAKGPTDENAARKQEGRRRLDSLIEERDKNRERFLEAVEILHTKETKHELITTFGIAQKLTAEIYELSNELQMDESIPNCTLEDIVRNSGMTDEAEITRTIHDKMKEIEYLRGVLRVMANPPMVDYSEAQNMVIEDSNREMRARETRRLINELREMSEKPNPPE